MTDTTPVQQAAEALVQVADAIADATFGQELPEARIDLARAARAAIAALKGDD